MCFSPLRLEERTLDFHSSNMGSNPVGDTFRISGGMADTEADYSPEFRKILGIAGSNPV